VGEERGEGRARESRAALPWLTARPIAHRGLHDAAQAIIENTASAAQAAIAGGYGIETDVQISATVRPWCIMTMRSAA